MIHLPEQKILIDGKYVLVTSVVATISKIIPYWEVFSSCIINCISWFYLVCFYE